MAALVVVAVLGLIWMLRNRERRPWAVVFACGLLTYSPFESGILSRLYPGIVVLAIFLLTWLANRPSIPSEQPSELGLLHKPLLGIVLVAAVSMIWSRISPDASVSYTFPNADVSLTVTQLSQAWILVTTVCMPFAVAASLESWKDIERTIMALGIVAGIGAVLTLLGLIYGFGGTWEILGIRRAYWDMPWHSAVHPLSALIAPFLYSAFLFGRRFLSSPWLMTLLLLTCLLGVLVSFSRENWVITFFQLSLLTALRFRRRLASAGVAVGVLLVVFAISFPGIITTLTTFFNPNEVYGLERTFFYETGLNLFSMHPILGVGSGNYQFFDLAYADVSVGGFSHNQFITIAAETGILGLLMFLWFLAVLLRINYRLRVLEADPNDPHYWIKAAGSVFILAWIVQCFFGEPFFATAAAGGGTKLLTMIIYSWVLLGILFAVCKLEATPQTVDRLPASSVLNRRQAVVSPNCG